MSQKEEQIQSDGGGIQNEDSQKLDTSQTSECSVDKDSDLLLCRVCHCAESDKRGDAALGFLDIVPPSPEVLDVKENSVSTDKIPPKGVEDDVTHRKKHGREHGYIEFIGPEGEVFVCSSDLESGPYHPRDTLVNLGCSCKNELALAHYACALKWFISHGSTICEICGSVAKNVRPSDFKKVMASLKEYESLRERTATGELTHVHVETNSGVDPDALAAVRRLRLSEVSLWFNLHNTTVTTVPQEMVDQSAIIPTENVVTESPTTKWAVEGTGILVATGLLTVTITWLLAPRVGKKTARNGLHVLLGGVCALTVVIFLRFVVLSRIRHGPARYWAILFVFWFLVFGIWASRTHGHQ